MTEEREIVVADESDDGNLFSGMPSEALASLTPAKNRMILMYLTGQYNLPRIANIIGVSVNTIRAWLGQPEVQEVIAELQKREFKIIDSSLKALRLKALGTVDNLMDSPMDAVALAAAKDVLDRTGHKAISEMKIEKTVTTIEKQLQELADFTIAESDVIDITDVIETIRGKDEAK